MVLSIFDAPRQPGAPAAMAATNGLRESASSMFVIVGHLGGADELESGKGPGQDDSPAGVSQTAQHNALDAIAKRPVACTQ